MPYSGHPVVVGVLPLCSRCILQPNQGEKNNQYIQSYVDRAYLFNCADILRVRGIDTFQTSHIHKWFMVSHHGDRE